MNRPWNDTYWLEPGVVLAGEYPGDREPNTASEKLRRLLDEGITLFLDLTRPAELVPYEVMLLEMAGRANKPVRYERLPIPDMGTPRSADAVNSALDVVEQAVCRGERVYVHCWGGIGRTGTIMGCWLVRQGYSGDHALEEVDRRYQAMAKRDSYPSSPQTERQRAYVRAWANLDDVRSKTAPTLQGRFRGAMLGLAAGDALGTTLEFRRRDSFSPINDMVGGGPFGLQPGQWTDDTSMAMCLAESLLERRGFDAADQMKRYVRWWREGYWSSTGMCFDIGNTVSAALQRFLQTGEPYSGSTDPRSAGNGSLMRLAPAVLAYSAQPERAVHMAAESSRTTHAAPQALQACRILSVWLLDALSGTIPTAEAMRARAGLSELHGDVQQVLEADTSALKRDAIRAGGYAVDTLEAAIWAFRTTKSFREGALRAVNLGEDADTTGAVFGQLAGAYYGVRGIPAAWRARIALGAEIQAAADGLLQLSRVIEPPT